MDRNVDTVDLIHQRLARRARSVSVGMAGSCPLHISDGPDFIATIALLKGDAMVQLEIRADTPEQLAQRICDEAIARVSY